MRTKAAASYSRTQLSLSLSLPIPLVFPKSRRRKKAAAAAAVVGLWPRNVNYFQTTENYDCCSSDVCSAAPVLRPRPRIARREEGIFVSSTLARPAAAAVPSLHNVSSSLTVLPLRGRGRTGGERARRGAGRGALCLSLGDECKLVECEQKKASGKFNARKPSIIAYCVAGAPSPSLAIPPRAAIGWPPKLKVAFQPISQKER